MNKIFNIAIISALAFAAAGCSDVLDTNSPSVTDREFVFSSEESARGALNYGYELLRANRNIHSVGIFWSPIWGSDMEGLQDAYSEGDTGQQEKNFYPTGTSEVNINGLQGWEVFGDLYKTIGVCNALIDSFEDLDNFESIMSGEPNALSDIYGQAVALRSTCYFELCRYYGDVPMVVHAGESANGLSSRFAIYDWCMEKLIAVEPHMFRAGENGTRADVMNRNYVQGLIGRIALFNAGYCTRRTDLNNDFYTDGSGNVLTFDDWGVEDPENKAVYGRRADWKKVLESALPYLEACISQPGSIKLHLSDPRANDAQGREFKSPAQYVFQQMHKDNSMDLADESVYEIPFMLNGGADRPGYIGRASTGGNYGAPCVGCGQNRIQPHVYYGWFDPKDARRDSYCCVTGTDGNGREFLLSLNQGNWGKVGITSNKWDWNRMKNPDTATYGNSAINVSYMRMSDVYLMLAEVYAALGQDGQAKTYLATVHNRNFPDGVDTNLESWIAECGNEFSSTSWSPMYKAVIKERALEFVGEGVRRFDLIRTGMLPEAAVNNRRDMGRVLDELEAKGYAEFNNGNCLPAYVWVKSVDAKSLNGYRLTASTPAGMEDDPLLYPAWRGVHDDWDGVLSGFGYATFGHNETNIAIKGLFEYIAPGSPEAQALEAEGYEQTNWGCDLLLDKDSHAYKVLGGCSDADFQSRKSPVTVRPFRYQDLLNSGLTNGYGFRQE
ncbi:MAG: RagB/SusD family nutrient uptake outer membrane protein [Muribaculaceae bacterium]|nr:RagB/SusD family nutrient uptake outer membrane protein [Muribaculaceae bacterium]